MKIGPFIACIAFIVFAGTPAGAVAKLENSLDITLPATDDIFYAEYRNSTPLEEIDCRAEYKPFFIRTNDGSIIGVKLRLTC